MFESNLLLNALHEQDRALIGPYLERSEARRGDILFNAGQSVDFVTFPCDSTVATLAIAMRDGRSAKTTSMGREGAIGGVVSQGHLPAFSQAVVQIGGPICRIDAAQLQLIKQRSTSVRNLLTRYADCLLAQVLQSVACNALHPIDRRTARCLLTLQDRVGTAVLPITQDMLADMLGVQRTYVTRVLQTLQHKGLVAVGRGRLKVSDRTALERSACECYSQVNAHFAMVLGPAVQVVNGSELNRPSSVGPQRTGNRGYGGR